MSVAARKIIYIVSLSHSGSTILDMLLTTAKKAVGLGQVWTVLQETPLQSRERTCSCGARATDCEMWGAIIERLGQLPFDAPSRDRYRLVLERAAELYGPEIAVIDSSKNAQHLKVMAHEFTDIDVAVLHNIKDVRAFTVSTLDNLKRKGRRPLLAEKIFYQWYRDNRKSCEVATKLLCRPPVRVMYEGLCLSTDTVVARIAKSLGEAYIDTNIALDHGYTHIIAGNRLRLPEEGKAKQLAYDYRWFVRSEWLRPYALMRHVRRYNEQCLRELTNAA